MSKIKNYLENTQVRCEKCSRKRLYFSPCECELNEIEYESTQRKTLPSITSKRNS